MQLGELVSSGAGVNALPDLRHIAGRAYCLGPVCDTKACMMRVTSCHQLEAAHRSTAIEQLGSPAARWLTCCVLEPKREFACQTILQRACHRRDAHGAVGEGPGHAPWHGAAAPHDQRHPHQAPHAYGSHDRAGHADAPGEYGAYVQGHVDGSGANGYPPPSERWRDYDAQGPPRSAHNVF